MVDYYTVTEYANLTGRDSGNIRRMLINGTLIGEKLGNQWIIPKSEKYPSDKRIKNGNYRNWRKKMTIRKNYPTLMKALLKMCYDIHGIYGDSVDKIILYGSYARGEESADSDVDIALILKADISQEQHDKMIDIVVDYELDLAVSLSVIPIEIQNYLEWKNSLPFYKNIEKEGIVLWKAA
ncbi:Uncharacterized protein D081_1266 [Anaerovibrio sp. JC8]|uniref:nucleotidyltransferase domain-containing protein n=1 Tax=Anaerovibrio sp. JC8 TaxID=1240085 RepID=UPI000A0BB0C0|nr:nucleotidyltransferase domain-containing protein [Anaerovibrio sp. JC8]ORU00172.1 Uncharacterized protein D081_1266 [Anaerovibrio sp. JC8]